MLAFVNVKGYICTKSASLYC